MKDEEPEEVQKTSGRAGGDLKSWDGLKDQRRLKEVTTGKETQKRLGDI